MINKNPTILSEISFQHRLQPIKNEQSLRQRPRQLLQKYLVGPPARRATRSSSVRCFTCSVCFLPGSDIFCTIVYKFFTEIRINSSISDCVFAGNCTGFRHSSFLTLPHCFLPHFTVGIVRPCHTGIGNLPYSWRCCYMLVKLWSLESPAKPWSQSNRPLESKLICDGACPGRYTHFCRFLHLC